MLDLEVGTTPLVYCIIMKVENILASVIFSVGNLLISIFRMLHYSINKLSLHIILILINYLPTQSATIYYHYAL